MASWPIRAQLLKPGRLNGSEEKRRQGNEAEELDVGRVGPAWPQIDPGLDQGVEFESYFVALDEQEGGGI